jgi:hypothetical protein
VSWRRAALIDVSWQRAALIDVSWQRAALIDTRAGSDLNGSASPSAADPGDLEYWFGMYDAGCQGARCNFGCVLATCQAGCQCMQAVACDCTCTLAARGLNPPSQRQVAQGCRCPVCSVMRDTIMKVGTTWRHSACEAGAHMLSGTSVGHCQTTWSGAKAAAGGQQSRHGQGRMCNNAAVCIIVARSIGQHRRHEQQLGMTELVARACGRCSKNIAGRL